MNAISQVGGAPQPDVWRQLIDLGSRLQNASRFQPATSSWFISQHQLIVETAARLVGAEASLWLPASLTRLLPAEPSTAVQVAEFQRRVSAAFTPLVEGALNRAATYLRIDGKPIQAPSPSGQADFTHLPLPQAFAIPLLKFGCDDAEPCVLGILQFERGDQSTFSTQEIELATVLASQVSLALQTSLSVLREQWRQVHLDLLTRFWASDARGRELESLCDSMARFLQKDFGYNIVAVYTLDLAAQVLSLQASASPGKSADNPSAEEISPRQTLGFDQGIVGHVARSGTELLANDVTREVHFRAQDALPEIRSAAAIPLKVDDRLYGVLEVQSQYLNFISDLDLPLLRLLATELALAIERQRDHTALQLRIDQLSSIYEVTNTLTALLEEEELLKQIVELIQHRFGYPYIHIFTVQPGLGRIAFAAGSGLRSQAINSEGLVFDLDDPQGLIPWVARHADTRMVNDVSIEPLYRPSPLPPDDTRSEMTIPLTFGGEVLGVLDVQSDRLNAFSEEDRFIFETLADNIAIAMRNAQLFRTESWRRRVADGMHEVVGMLSGDASLDAVLETVLVELQHTLPQEAAAIWLAERAITIDAPGTTPLLRLSAMRGDILSGLDLEPGCTPDEILELNPHAPAGQTSPSSLAQPSDWLVEAIRSGQPTIRTVDSPSDPLAAALGFPSDHSAIAAPLKIGENSFGVLTLLDRTPRRYGREAHAIVETFANYAAVAIENTRLYEASHEQAWLSTVLLRVTEATQELTGLDELLETVTAITPSLTGVVACLLYLNDEDGCFIPTAASGLEKGQLERFTSRIFTRNEIPALYALAELKTPLFLDWDQANYPLWSIFAVDLEDAAKQEGPFAVLVPLLSHNDLLGAFVVEYATDPASLSPQPAVDTHQEESLAILQGIARQTAIAVENIRLLGAQKEEAYVSVALLQVAEAIVCSQDLLEALGAIVRITPILVGVDRAVIFLRDPSRQSFRSVQSYGTGHDQTEYEYQLGEFPLLDSVLETNQLLAFPLPEDKDVFKDTPDDWSFLIPPDTDEIEIFLNESKRLLIALPLSVKGEVLGALLVEEPLPEQSAKFHTRTNRRLRGKRLEILTGVSQQTALVIQNDLLQREMVERERLERELQLARQIQRTFLPEVIPDLAGWDLRVCWRTAREVGGDFYDFFDLPGQRLGLVIADVADKGMPAALFMTVVRSLVRASLDIRDTPAAVLERVNRLIVPDATQGMFITLAYAVLDLGTGRLNFANAGHNPPLLVRHASSTIEPLPRGGMALGVLEDNLIQGGTTHLDPGDFLVMYTDGVTEAFAPDGSFFGEERLFETIIDEITSADPVTSRDAQRLVDVIDQRVSQFIGGLPRSDDLTLMVLKRLEDL